MINIKTTKITLSNKGFEKIKNSFVENAFKTNINPQLMFKQSYSGVTGKTFVGNWTKNGFWISKFRMQLFNLRPDIIAEFILNNTSKKDFEIKYSIGFSSLIVWVFFGLIVSFYFINYGGMIFTLCWIAWTAIYILLAAYSLNRTEKKINERIIKHK